MTPDDKKQEPTQPAGNNTQPATTQTSADNVQDTSANNGEESTGDYVVMGSGLGIDE